MKLFAFHLHRTENPWHTAPPWALELRGMMWAILNLESESTMASQKNIADLTTAVAANTNATKAAEDALNHYASSNADLAKQLADAIAANSATKDDPAIQAAIDALNANNTELTASVPVVAAAITTNTPAA
jgi:Asp-tRNA(Asn)/Glu-tRNA(Gln) amidotransferase B subunit